jgi:hypothetical protein
VRFCDQAHRLSFDVDVSGRCARFGHFFFEKNKPASFIYPTYSFMSDLKMCYLVVTGQEPIW